MAILNTEDPNSNPVKRQLVDEKIYYINGYLRAILDAYTLTENQIFTLENKCNELIADMRYLTTNGVLSVAESGEIIKKMNYEMEQVRNKEN